MLVLGSREGAGIEFNPAVLNATPLEPRTKNQDCHKTFLGILFLGSREVEFNPPGLNC